MTWASELVVAVQDALRPLADAERAIGMRAYMKDIAPFLGIGTVPRRVAQSTVWKSLGPPPDQDQLARASVDLFALDEREFAYAACDLLKRQARHCEPEFLADPVEELLTTKPWWDTVDSLGSAVVSPLSLSYPELRSVILRWSASGDGWLVRAAIQHQRGWKEATDVAFVLELCDDHADEAWFFNQKAIGWALRDLAALDPVAVERFVTTHPQLTRVAVREAERGLSRAY